jgi:hypothetical protein
MRTWFRASATVCNVVQRFVDAASGGCGGAGRAGTLTCRRYARFTAVAARAACRLAFGLLDVVPPLLHSCWPFMRDTNVVFCAAYTVPSQRMV